jgi:hypothetical protein
MPINLPLGSFRNATWTGWRLTTGDRYLILPRAVAEAIESRPPTKYWAFMAEQLRGIGLSQFTEANAWRAFAD